MTDCDGALLREFWIHRDGWELGPTGGPKKLYVFPITASVRDADGLTARMRMTCETVEKVRFS